MTRFLQAAGLPVLHEVPILGKVADICALRSDGALIAIECKERDWGRAFIQARVYQGAAPSVYVALPRNNTTSKCLARAAIHGLGVLTVDDGRDVSEVLTPQCADHYAPLLARVVLERWDQIMEIRYASH
ncbi:MAG: hypothetical protein ACYCUD_10405 [Candidatus Dormibacteria bacterium]